MSDGSMHPQAMARFDEIATDILQRIEPVAEEESGSDFKLNLAGGVVITEDQVLDLERIETDARGHESGRTFRSRGATVALRSEAYRRLRDLSERLAKTKPFESRVSQNALRSQLIRWLKARHGGDADVSASACEHLLATLLPEVDSREVWLPLRNLFLQSPIAIARITILELSESRINEWVSAVSRERPEDEDSAREYFERFQGHAAAVVRIAAEPVRARELAIEETELALSLLRFLDPATFVPERMLNCATVVGSTGRDAIATLDWSNGILGRHEGPVGTSLSLPWKIDDRVKAGLDSDISALTALATVESPTQFQRQLLKAVRIFSRAALSSDLADNLLHTMVALETMLLKDSNEPITYCLSDRLAILSARAPEDRKRMSAMTRRLYALRSGFVHHGVSPDKDSDLLAEWMGWVWGVMIRLVRKHTQFNTTRALIDAIEDEKFK